MLELYAKTFGNVTFGVACEGQRVFAAGFWNNPQETVTKLRRELPPNVSSQVAKEPSAFAAKALTTVKDVYEGKGATEEVPLALERFPLYTQRVLKTVSQIPVGYVTSYGAVAEAAGGGARAVGNVMANNAFAPIVPCHRVVTSSLGLGGYGGGGLRVKYEFLKREKRGYTEPSEVLAEGRVLKVFPVEFVLQKLDRFFAK
jgi:methylated-DNA-[protein]-cysteine S-methyltransferase